MVLHRRDDRTVQQMKNVVYCSIINILSGGGEFTKSSANPRPARV